MTELPFFDLLSQRSTPKLTTFARQLRKNMTHAERVFWARVRGRRLQGLYFRRQSVVGGYIVDFYCSELRLAIELDGPIHDQRRAHDRQRDRTMQWLGVRVARVTNEEVFSNLDALLERLVREARADHVSGRWPREQPGEKLAPIFLPTAQRCTAYPSSDPPPCGVREGMGEVSLRGMGQVPARACSPDRAARRSASPSGPARAISRPERARRGRR